MQTKTHQALLWDKITDKDNNTLVQCKLCNFRCKIADGQRGHCQVRKNIDGKLYSLNYHSIIALNVDPIEKKPLFHFQPGSKSFSIAAAGCNFQCDFCQNWQISQSPRMQRLHDTNHHIAGQSYSPQTIVNAAIQHNCSSIAYTYTEPTIFMELAAECSQLAHQNNIANVFVSNGYMTTEAIDYASSFLDAINVDLKSFNDDFYRTVCKARLEPVLQTLKYIAHNTDIWLEVTTLLIPGANDSADEIQSIANFIAHQLGPHVPWHISRFYPNFERTNTPPTPRETLTKAYKIGKQAGLRYIYTGNIPGDKHESTFCYNCNQLLIKRIGYTIDRINLNNDNTCPNCGTKLDGIPNVYGNSRQGL